jgi:hypothetical protein
MVFKKREKKPDGLHAYICTPAYDGKVDCDYSQSLAEAAFCAPLYEIKITAAVMGNGAFIELARNIFVKKFLEEFTDTSHLFFIDADLKFEARAFIGLMQANLPICAGVYRRRQEPETYPFNGAENPNGGGLWFIDDWLQCLRVPTGFLCISRKVLTEMAADAPQVEIFQQNGPVPWVFHTKLTDEPIPKFVGEDYAFCDDYVAKYKAKIPVWTNFDFRHGGYDCNMFKFLTKEVDKSKEQNTSSAA